MAVRKYSLSRFEAVAPQVVFRLQRWPASGAYGNLAVYRSLWDEYRHHIQIEGPELREWSWDEIITPVLDLATSKIPSVDFDLLAIGAAWIVDSFDGRPEHRFITVRDCLLDQVKTLASQKLPRKYDEVWG
jgi:hypothetical protein